MITHITPPEAWTILQNDADTILLDVRTTMEFEYVGHPVGAIHVPLMEAPDWNSFPDFTQNVRRVLQSIDALKDKKPEELTILALCRSGKRSEAAAEALLADNFKSVYNIIEGFEGDRDDHKHRNTLNGWKFHNLPWEQS